MVWFWLDGIGDNEDINEIGLTDIREDEIGTDPYNGDTDGDRWDDSWDKMPLDPSSRSDLDGDGIPDEKWIDQNGDGFFDLHYGGDDGDPYQLMKIWMAMDYQMNMKKISQKPISGTLILMMMVIMI